MPISLAASTYLNFVRWFAAFAVVLFHFHDHHFGPDSITRYFPSNGHGYVMVFFVLSGFFISMAAENKTASEFALDRAIRIYIVALPVLFICGALAQWGPVAPSDKNGIATFLLNLTFLSQSWWLNRPPPLDVPYWSLCYEVMYYIIFAAFYFSGRYRWPATLIVCAIAGPKILVLFPCWMLGAASFRFRTLKAPQPIALAAIIGGPVVVIASMALFKGQLNALSDSLGFRFTQSEGFLRSWAVALCFAVHLWGVCQLRLVPPARIAGLSKSMAEMSYSLYLLHLPIVLTLVCLAENPSAFWLIYAGIPLTLSLCYLFSLVTEQNRGRAKILVQSVLHIPRPSSVRS